jgi:protein-L-isoaspartate(D-aspartate) O-methyltransferase
VTVPVATTPEWEAAFRGLPRSLFLPDLIWTHDVRSGVSTPVHRGEDPAAWQEAAESNAAIVTQWDDGRHTGREPGRMATSSGSAPSLVASMLAALDIEPGMRVLEIGTGTGWNAALLAHRLGDEAVVTVEVDPDVAERARAALKRAGRSPRALTADGSGGWAEGAPYDRIIATCGLRRIPAAWLKQVRPGGVILAPWGTDFTTRDALARLTVHGDGTASGPLLQFVEFMKLRSQRFRTPDYPPGLPVEDTTTTEWPPSGDGRAWHPFRFLAGLRMRRASYALQEHDDGHTQWLYSLSDDSWTAAVRRESTGSDIVVRRVGHRRLWEEYVATHAWWTAQGEPGVERFGLTVTPEGQQVWLDDPGRPVGA